MDLVLTPGEIAERLGLDEDAIHALFEQGYLSGFHHGDSWRITAAALVADLERLHAQLAPAPAAQLAPRSESAFRVPAALVPKSPRAAEKHVYPERFAIAIDVDNESDYSGPIAVYLGTEHADAPWKVHEAAEFNTDDDEIMVRGDTTAGRASVLLRATLQGALGDRVFLAIPEQPGVDAALEKVVVLDDDLHLRITIFNRGLFGRKRGVRVKSIIERELPRTGTE